MSLNNSNDIIANSVSLICSDGKSYADVRQMINSISGRPPLDLSNLEQMAASINNDAAYLNTVNQQSHNVLNHVSTTLNSKLTVSDSNVTTSSLFNSLATELLISDAANTFNSKLNVADSVVTTNSLLNTISTKLSVVDANVTTNSLVGSISSKLDSVSIGATTTSLLPQI